MTNGAEDEHGAVDIDDDDDDDDMDIDDDGDDERVSGFFTFRGKNGNLYLTNIASPHNLLGVSVEKTSRRLAEEEE